MAISISSEEMALSDSNIPDPDILTASSSLEITWMVSLDLLILPFPIWIFNHQETILNFGDQLVHIPGIAFDGDLVGIPGSIINIGMYTDPDSGKCFQIS